MNVEDKMWKINAAVALYPSTCEPFGLLPRGPCAAMNERNLRPLPLNRGGEEVCGRDGNEKLEPPGRQTAARTGERPPVNACAGPGRKPTGFPSIAQDHWA